ncbi:hypothetical protein HHK36_033195 [Tetracentron sinense]|uniref:Uncharacterized protein n=1 Tax=Tetracentron sinense TaxID=13715 RepID=A0A835CWC4_TETSI|nr:hypothetical protein HHK36_033195 [Tetracentron sinense]
MESVHAKSKAFFAILLVFLVFNCFGVFRSIAQLLPEDEVYLYGYIIEATPPRRSPVPPSIGLGHAILEGNIGPPYSSSPTLGSDAPTIAPSIMLPPLVATDIQPLPSTSSSTSTLQPATSPTTLATHSISPSRISPPLHGDHRASPTAAVFSLASLQPESSHPTAPPIDLHVDLPNLQPESSSNCSTH